jgi:hypothetical protein
MKKVLIMPALAAVLFAAACDGDPSGARTPVPVSSITLQPAPLLLVAGTTGQLTAILRDAGGTVLTGREVSWSTSAPNVASVDQGSVMAMAPGVATVSATSEGITAQAEVTVTLPVATELFTRPFASSFPVGSPFDHDMPLWPQHNNGILRAFWGEDVSGIDGHNGYDWILPTGTPLRAVAPGQVLFAGTETPFFCPLLNSTVAGLWVVLEHLLPGGETVRTQYGHFSQLSVTTGQMVTAGQVIGLSGSTGCSTAPHLHFTTLRKRASGAWSATDPYGWTAPFTDPWSTHSLGVPSHDLWGAGSRVQLYREIGMPPFNGNGEQWPIGIARIRYMGENDAANPNNEFVEIVSDARYAGPSHDLSGYRLRNNAGEEFSFPAGFRIEAGRNVRIFSGTGVGTPTELYWGRAAPAWGNRGDCARVTYPGGTRWTWRYGNSNGCPEPSDGALPSAIGSTPAPMPLDWSPRGTLQH